MNLFFPDVADLHGWCGPTSLTAALWTLAVDTTPELVARAGSRTPSQLVRSGMREEQLEEAARTLGVEVETLVVDSKNSERSFVAKLASNIEQGRPAVMAMNYDGEGWDHWVGVLATRGSEFLVVDSNNESVTWWSRKMLLEWGWNGQEWDAGDEEGNYFALVLGDAHAQMSRRMLTPQFLDLFDEDATVDGIIADLTELLRRAGASAGPGVPVTELLKKTGERALDDVAYWIGLDRSGLAPLSALLKQLGVVAEAYQLEVRGCDEGRLASGLVALLSVTALIE